MMNKITKQSWENSKKGGVLMSCPIEADLDSIPLTNQERHQAIISQLHKTYVDKNKKYGDSFANTIQKYGYISALTRMSDKFSRIETFILDKTIHDEQESVVDSLIDLANYCIMTAMELQKDAIR